MDNANDKSIQVLKPKFRTEEILNEIRVCFDKGWTGMGFKTEEFEAAWSNYTGLPNSHFLSSNTVGLHLALRIFKDRYGWQDGDQIITTPLTFVSTNHAILYENLTPVFADVDEYLCISPESLENRINEKTKAVMYVGIGGNPGRLDEVEKICDKHGLRLILDAAHMSGTYVNRDGKIQHVGHEADATVFSFQAVKNLPTADSGMICFKDSKDLEFCKKLSWLGIDKDTYSRTEIEGSYKWKYSVPYLGYKYHGNSIMASIGLVQLKYLDADNEYRRKISVLYKKKLGEIENLSIINASEYCAKSSKHLFQVLIHPFKRKTRDGLLAYLGEHNVFCGVHYIDNMQYDMYKNKNSCPVASSYSDKLLSLPLHLGIINKDVETICNLLERYMER